MPLNKDEIIEKLHPLFAGTGGIDSWIGLSTPEIVFERLGSLDNSPISMSQLNQLLVLSSEAGMKPPFFEYYWTSKPGHTYDVTKIPEFEETHVRASSITSLSHLKWGLYRFYVDALLYFGNIRTAYRTLRTMTYKQLESFFERKRYNTQLMQARGAPLALVPINKDDRYLISEMACKTYEDDATKLREVLASALQKRRRPRRSKAGGTGLPTVTYTTINELLETPYVRDTYRDEAVQFEFSLTAVANQAVSSEAEINTVLNGVVRNFSAARAAALENTKYYLSMVDDLDVYVATSMRSREDFRKMADKCEGIFRDTRLRELHIRYFDPTMSAAEGHEDKGLIECLMVKCAKTLIYYAGVRESYGKDAEAAMALSLGKPVIFLCDEEQKSRFFRDIHPLSRLIDFQTGVPVGAMVAISTEQVSTLLYRLFENKMEYEIERTKTGYLRLREKLTNSVVRLQTSDDLLRETFWNYYHNRP